MYNILVIDDDESILEIIKDYLTCKDYDVKTATSINEAICLLDSFEPHCIILDVKLPDGLGYDACGLIKAKANVPVIFLSSLGEEQSRIKGFVSGGDDYVVKPFSVVELEYRIKVRIKNRYKTAEAEKEMQSLQFGVLSIDEQQRKVSVKNNGILLTSKEFDILLLMAKRPEVIFSHEKIFNAVWKQSDNDDVRTVQVHVSNLRRKLDKILPDEKVIRTAWRNGYKFTTKDIKNDDDTAELKNE